MKVFRRMLFVGALPAFALSTAWAAEGNPDNGAATHEEIEPLDIQFKRLSTLRLDRYGRLVAASCSNIAIAVTLGGDQVYVMDVKNNLIRVLQKKYEKDKRPTTRPRRRIRIFDGRSAGLRGT